MLVTSIFSFSHNVFKSFLIQRCSGLCGKGLKIYNTYLDFLFVIIVKNPPTQQPTQPPRQTTTEPVAQPPVLEQTANQSDMNLPIIIGGGVSGFVLIMIIILVIGCLFLRRQRGNLDEKVHGIFFFYLLLYMFLQSLDFKLSLP